MSRRKKVDATVRVVLRIPTSLAAEVDLLLYSEAEGCIPHGDISRFYEEILREYLTKLKQARQNVLAQTTTGE